jgi:hypothetical protein
MLMAARDGLDSAIRVFSTAAMIHGKWLTRHRWLLAAFRGATTAGRGCDSATRSAD